MVKPTVAEVTSSEDREAWLAARREVIGASEVAALLGESKYSTREDLLRVKAGLEPEFFGNEQTDIGLWLEPAVAELATDRFGWSLEKHGCLTVDSECSRLGATPDYVMRTPWGHAAVQIKVTSCTPTDACKPKKDGSPSTAAFANGPPIWYQLQVQTELACLNLHHGVLLVLHTGPLALRSYYVPRHDGVIARIRAETARAWAEIESMRGT